MSNHRTYKRRYTMNTSRKSVLIVKAITPDEQGFGVSNYVVTNMLRNLNTVLQDENIAYTYKYARDLIGKNVSELVGKYSGVIVPGGADIDPELYGGTRETNHRYNSVMDDIQINITQEALKQSMPFFGICRGLQIINVATGGTLYEDLSAISSTDHNNFEATAYRDKTTNHQVKVLSQSIVLKPQTLNVVSLHHQGIKELGSGLTVTAVDESEGFQLPEAVEHKNGNVVAVQWHPEHSQSESFEPLTELLQVFPKHTGHTEKIRELSFK